MRDLGKVVGHIPARGGSQRVPAKNLRFLVGKPLLAYAVECALGCGVLDEVYVNTDSDHLAALAESLGTRVHRRRAELASATATGDDFTADFIAATQPDTLVMINPVCPLVEPEDVQGALQAFRESSCDTLISCDQTQMQTFVEGKAVNIDADAALAPTQENPRVQVLNWAVTIWDTEVFSESYRRHGNGYLGSQRLLYPIAPSHSLKISHEEDFRMAELLLRARDLVTAEVAAPSYWTSKE